MVRWARRRSAFGVLGGIGSAAFFAVWFGVLIFGIVGQVSDINTKRELRRDSVATTAIALTTRSEEWHDDDGGTHIVYRTKVGYLVGTDRRVAEIAGKFAEGENVAIVYDPDDPDVIRTEANIQSITENVIGIVVMGGMIVFGIGFAISWFRFDRW